VVAPIVPSAEWSRCLAFAHGVSRAIEDSDPTAFTTKFAKAGRDSKILLDYLRNNRTNTSVAAFSLRARNTATVSVPLAWTELKPALATESFSVITVPARLARLRSDPWKGYWSTRQTLTESMIRAAAAMREIA
jgi:bifunctional non-homologous end joining protein LigD